MKRLRYMRHPSFNNKTGVIPQVELDRIQRVQREAYTDVFYGPIYRTLQTALAVVAALGVTVRIHETVMEIGDGPTIDRALDIVKSMDQGKEPPRSLEEYVEPLKKMFGLLSENSFGLAVGHGSMIELAALGLGHKIGIVPKGVGVDFIQDEMGEISVVIS